MTDIAISIDRIRIAMDAALLASPELAAVIAGRIFDGMAPEATPLPYIRYGSMSESPLRRFNRHSSRNTLVIDAFTGDASNDTALKIYRAIKESLHLVKLPLEGGGYAIGEVELVGTVVDPEGGTNAIMYYTPRVK